MRFVVLIVVAFILGILMAFLEVSQPLGWFQSMAILAGLSTYLFVYPVYLEKNVNRIEAFIEKRRKNPLYKLYYGMGNRIDKDVKEATEMLLQKYKQPARQAIFKTLLALYEDDILRAKRDIEDIHPPQYKYYYQTIVAIEEGNMERATELKELVKTEWMKHALAAGIANKAGNHKEYLAEIQKAFEKTRGLQRYVIYKQYEADLKLV